MADLDNRRILLVDDDADVRALLRHVLAEESLEIDEAESGDDALSRLAEIRYSVVLLDLLMPNGTGLDVIERLTAQANHGAIVLVLTGAPDEIVQQLDASRVHGIIRKPFDPIDVADIVRSCVEVRSHRSLNAMCIATVVAGSPLIAWFARGL